MALPQTPDEWLTRLAKRLDDRFDSIKTRRDYTNGRAPLPEMGKNLRESWIAFQRKARTDFGGIAVDSLASRISPNGIRVGQSTDSPELRMARKIWRDNRMDVQVDDAIIDYLQTGIGYIAVGTDESVSGPIMSREKPELFYADPEPLRPWKARAALKVWRDREQGTDFATVWAPGLMQRYFRPSMNDDELLTRASDAGWLPLGAPAPYAGGVPVAILERKDGQGFVQPHEDVIDRINLGKLQRLVTAAMQAFTQRAIKGDLPDKDETGKPIDYSETFVPAPGALWELPEGIEIWESKTTTTQTLLDGETRDARDFSAVSRTPMSVFAPDGANMSAEGASSAKEAQIQQARKEINRLSPGIALAIVYGLRAAGIELDEDTVEVLWIPPQHVSMTERYTAAQQAKAAGQSQKLIMRDILGMSPDQIAQEEQDLSTEMLKAGLLGAGTGGGGNAGP